MAVNRVLLRSITATVALVGLAIAAGLTTGGPAKALDDDGKDNVFNAVLGMIYLAPTKEQPEIDYRERSLLVLPPKMDLPPPAQPGARPAAWPQDPDVLRRKKAAEEAKMPAFMTRNGDGELMRKDKLLAGRTAGASEEKPKSDLEHCGRGECTWIPPDVLEKEGEAAKALMQGDSDTDTVLGGQEPDRKYLTDPPKGYRKATKTTKATTEPPVKVSNDPIDFWKKISPFNSSDDE